MKQKLAKILKIIEDIEYFLYIKNYKVVEVLKDRILKPAIRMQFIVLAEQFNKLKNENEFEILSKFDKADLKGISAVRNFIAHDYDSVDDEILENVIRFHLPKIKSKVKEILDEN